MAFEPTQHQLNLDSELTEVLLEWIALYGDSVQPWGRLTDMTHQKTTIYTAYILAKEYIVSVGPLQLQITEKGKQWLQQN